jgi:Fe-S oxidoreductase
VILVDNGRLDMLEDPEMREALYCIKCGACLNVCPVYRAIGGHAYGNSYMGGIGAIVTAFHRSLSSAEETIDLCNGCGTCKTVCPSKIDIPDLTNELRHRLVDQNGLRPGSKLVLHGLLKNPNLMRKCVGLARFLQVPFARDGRIHHAPLMPGFRTNPAIAGKSLRDTLPPLLKPHDAPKTRVALYSGCMADFIYPEIGESAARVMVQGGAEVSYPSDQCCCGAAALYCGDLETAVELAKRNIAALEAGSPGYIVTVCPTCAVALKEDFPRLLSGTEWENRANLLAAKVMDFSDFALNVMKLEPEQSNTRVTYHDPCHQARGVGGKEAPRELLKRAGMELAEMSESDVCCGFAGSYSMKLPDVSESILARKLKSINSVESEIVVTDCPGCIMQIRGGLEKAGSKIKVCHTAEMLCGI